MSRIGNQSIKIPEQVSISLKDQTVIVKGPKGILSKVLPAQLKCTLDSTKQILCLIKIQNTKVTRSLHGLFRTLIENMVVGVSQGFEKRLQITGVGYRAQIIKEELLLNLGYSHEIRLVIPSDLTILVENPTNITVLGIEKERVGEFAAKIRALRLPEPYKGKGISYENELILRKAGKTGR